MMYEFTHRLSHQPFPSASRNEDEYFRRQEIERRLTRARQREKEREEEERIRLKELHEGFCPGCGSDLEEVEVAEGRVQQCPLCRGVWMAREMFDQLTHHEKGSYLSSIFRGVLLDFTLGDLPAKEEG